MKKLLKILLMLFAALGIIGILIIIGIWYFFHSVVPKDDPAAQAAMEKMLPPIVAQWDINELQKDLAANFMVEIDNAPTSGGGNTTASMKSDNIADAAKIFAQAKEDLGVMRHANKIMCHQRKTDDTINCNTLIKTEKAQPLIDVDMKNIDGQYKIVKFKIFNSDY